MFKVRYFYKISNSSFYAFFFVVDLVHLIFHFFPKLVSFLSKKSAKLPNKEQRFVFNKSQLDEVTIINKQNFKFNSIDLFIRSKKYDFKNLKKSKNIFLLNPFYIENEIKNPIGVEKRTNPFLQ